MPIDDPIISPKGIASADGELVAGSQVKLEAPDGNGNLADTVTDAEALKNAVDDLTLGSMGGQLNDENVLVADTDKTGLLAGSADAEEAFNRIDNTGLGAAPRSFTGSFFASYGQNGNQDQWYGGRASVTMIGARGQTNANRIFELPDPSELNTMFDDQVARGLGEVYQITIGYLGGTTQSVVRNSMTIRPPSVSALFDRNELPVTIAQGSEVTFRITRTGGTLGQWERISVSQSVDPVATFGEVVLQNLGWNNANNSFLPPSSSVQKGYAFPVIGSNPNDGTLRQGLIDAGVSDRVIYDGDYVVWTADAFTSWTNGDDWFVINRDSLQRMSREESNFLAQASEIDNRVDIALATMAGADAVVWLSENPLAEAPFITPSTDSSNPRAGDDYPYIGGRENRDGMNRFTFGQNRFNSYLTVGINPNFIAAHPESTIDIIFRDTDGTITQRLNLATDFTFRDDATFTNSTYRHYTRSASVNYAFLETIEIWLTQVQEHFRLSPNTVDVTQNVMNLSESQLDAAVREKLNRALPTPGTDFSSIEDRLMRRGQIQHNTPDHLARFRSSSATAAYPQQLSDFSQVSVDNPRFQATDVVLFVATPEPGLFVLMNTTTDTPIPLADTTPNVEVIESFSDSGTTYFVWRVTGITSGNRFEVTRTTLEDIIVERNDIANLQEDVERIDAELEHAALSLPAAVVDILDNELTITEESTPTTVSSAYNNGLGNTNAQTVFFESSPIAPSAGQKRSNAFNLNTGDRTGRKLAYIDADAAYGNSVILSSSTGTDLMHYTNGAFNVNVFVPAIPASTTTQTIYPAPSNRVSGAGTWHNIPALTFVNGVPVPEADELFFTRNIPDTATTLTIQYRGHANGNIFGTNTTTLANVGGSTDQFANFSINDGSETAFIEVRYDASARNIRVSVTERVNAGLPTINDIEVILSYVETRTVPATNARTRQVEIEHVHDGAQVFAFKPSATNTLIIVGDRTEIDTNRAYTDLFGADQSGWLVLFNDMAEFYDYEDFEPIAATVTDLENHASLPQRGLFTTQYTRETVLNIGVTIRPQGINVADLPTSSTGLVTGDLWNDSGTLRIV